MSAAAKAELQIEQNEGVERMTYLDIVYNYGSLPTENALRAIDSMRRQAHAL